MMKYKVLLIVCLLSAAAICFNYFCGHDRNLEQARAIYNGKTESGDGIFKNALAGMKKSDEAFAELKKGNLAGFEMLMFQSYLNFQSSNKTVAEPYLIETIDRLIKAGNVKWLAEFIKLGNVSADFAICVYGCAGNPKIMDAFTYDFIEKNFAGTSARSWLIRAKNDYRKISEEKAERDLYYAGVTFGIHQKNTDDGKWSSFSRPLAAYLAKLKGRNDLYEIFKKKSLSPETLKDIRASLYEYCEYAAKIFARCGDPKVSVSLLELLPDGRRKNLSLKRTVRDILKSNGGREAIEKSSLGKILSDGENTSRITYGQ